MLNNWKWYYDIMLVGLGSALVLVFLLAIDHLPVKVENVDQESTHPIIHADDLITSSPPTEDGFVSGMRSMRSGSNFSSSDRFQTRKGTVVKPNRYLFREDGSNRRQSRTDTHNRKFLQDERSRRETPCSASSIRSETERLSFRCK